MSRNTLLPLLMYVPIVLSFAGDASLPFRFTDTGFIWERQRDFVHSYFIYIDVTLVTNLVKTLDADRIFHAVISFFLSVGQM